MRNWKRSRVEVDMLNAGKERKKTTEAFGGSDLGYKDATAPRR